MIVCGCDEADITICRMEPYLPRLVSPRLFLLGLQRLTHMSYRN